MTLRGGSHIPRRIDLHVHLVPGVDDGPATWREAEELLDRIRSGMSRPAVVIATPHIRLSLNRRVAESQEVRVQDYLSQADSGPPGGDFSILSAREVMLDTGRMSSYLLDSYCIPGTSWILVELDPRTGWRRSRKRLRKVLEHGFRPLLAHPERYRWCMGHPERVLELSRMGTGIQVSARSLSAGGPLADAAWELVERGYTHVLASDAHSASDIVLSQEFGAEVDRRTGGAYNLLTEEMPGMVLDNRRLPDLPLFGG